MKKRGNVVRAPRDGPGLLMIEGRQFWFSSDRVWKSELPPRSGQIVEVEFHHESAITAITPVPESPPAEVSEKPGERQTEGCFKKFLAKLRASGGSRDCRRAERNSEEIENP